MSESYTSCENHYACEKREGVAVNKSILCSICSTKQQKWSVVHICICLFVKLFFRRGSLEKKNCMEKCDTFMSANVSCF